MAFLSCSDESSKSDFIVFPSKFNLVRDIDSGDIVYIVGKVEKRFDKYQLVVNELLELKEEGV